jgi:hypothetical protein
VPGPGDRAIRNDAAMRAARLSSMSSMVDGGGKPFSGVAGRGGGQGVVRVVFKVRIR